MLLFTTNLLEISKPFIRKFLLLSLFYLVFPRTKKSEAHGKVVVERTRTANSYKTRYMHARLCYHFKCLSLLIMMEWLDSHVNSAIDMCFRDYCDFWKGNVHECVDRIMLQCSKSLHNKKKLVSYNNF